MKKYFLPIFIVSALLFLSYLAPAAYASGDIWAITPNANVNWSAGGTKDINWKYLNSNYYNFICTQSVRLVPASANSLLPTYMGEVISRSNGDGAGRLVIPSDAVPGQYQVKVSCRENNGAGVESLSAGIVTLVNSAFRPVTFSQPVTPVTYTAGNYVPIVVNANKALAVGTPVTINLIKKPSPPETVVWTTSGAAPCVLTDIGALTPYCGTAIQTSETAQFSAGGYFLKAEVQFDGQTYEDRSVEITFTAPENRTLAVITPLDGDVWRTNEPNEIAWTSQNLTGNVVINRYAVSDPTGLNPLGTATVPVADGSYNIPTNVLTSGNYYYILTVGGLTARSGNFTVVEGEGPPPGDGDGIVHAAEPPEWNPPKYPPPECTGALGDDPGCYPPINVSIKPQWKQGALQVGALTSILGINITNNESYGLPSNLLLGVNGRVGADEYCDKNGANCYPIADLVGGEGPSGGVSKIIAGTNITISPSGGTGEVTISSTGGGPANLPTCSNGQVLKWSGGWGCGTDEIGAAGTGDITSVKSSGPKSGLTVKSSTIVDGDTVGGEVLSGDSIISLRRDCSTGEILKWMGSAGGGWKCQPDNVGTGGGGVTGIAGITGGGLRFESTEVSGGYYRGDVRIFGGDITGVTASAGLSGGGVSGDVSLVIQDGGVTYSKIADDAVSLSKIRGFDYKSCSSNNDADGIVVCDCDPGKKIIGGGAICTGSSNYLKSSVPQFETRWNAQCSETGKTMAVTIICATR